MKWFAEVKTVEELRKRYRELLRKYHPDNENGSAEITQQINEQYDALFSILSKGGLTGQFFLSGVFNGGRRSYRGRKR